MFVFSEMYARQNDETVQQVLVFSSQTMKVCFEKTYSIATQKHEPELVQVVSENGMGAIYKLRSVLCEDGRYLPVIRCGFTGECLVKLGRVETPEEAIQACKIYMKNSINTAL